MHRPLLYLFIAITLIVGVIYGIGEGWYSFVILFLLAFFGGSFFLNRSYQFEKENVSTVFAYGFCLYSLYTFITNYLYVRDPSLDFFMMVDSLKFWDNSNFKMESFSSVLYQYSKLSEEVSRYRFFNFLSLCLAFVGQSIDENNILLQKLQSIFLGAFSLPYIYLIFKKYTPRYKALKYTLIFGTVSYVLIYSTVFNRDPHVYFIFTIGFYLLTHYNAKNNVFIKLLICWALLFGLRLEHALFFSVFVLCYSYLKYRRYKILLLGFGILVPVLLIFATPLLFSSYVDNADRYQEKIEITERKSASVGAQLSKLPPGVKQITMGLHSQFAPAIPFWRNWSEDYVSRKNIKYSSPGYYTPWRFGESLAAIVWVFVIFILIYGLLKKMYLQIPIELNLSLLISFLLIVAASSVINTRRIYCVYPIMFVVATVWYKLFNKNQQKSVIAVSIFFISGVSLYYLVN